MVPAKCLRVVPEGRPAVDLQPGDHLATGGEGAVYAKDDTVYKLYLDPDRALAAGMVDKVRLLAQLRHPGIVAPRGIVHDSRGRFLGLWLPRARGEALCRAFTSSWRTAQGMAAAHTAAAVASMRNVVQAAHAGGAVMADANEMNWLLWQLDTAQVIDVDSWQIGKFPATAIMPSIRDWHTPTLCQNSDWFAFAVVSFQLWTGLHPYKGRHPDWPPGALTARMQARVSLFDARTRVPATARPLSSIPHRLRTWYEQVFQGVERSTPPEPTLGALGSAQPTTTARAVGTTLIRQQRLVTLPGPIRLVRNAVAIHAVGTELGAWDAVTQTAVPTLSSADLTALLAAEAGLLRHADQLYVVTQQAGALQVRNLTTPGAVAVLPAPAGRLWQVDQRLFHCVEGASAGVWELELVVLAKQPRLAIRATWPIAPLSSRFFDGILVQDCLGTPFIGVASEQGMLQAPALAVRAVRTVAGFARTGDDVVLVGQRRRDGEWVRWTLTTGPRGFEPTSEVVVDGPALNVAQAANGVRVLWHDGELLLTQQQRQRVLPAAGLPPDAKLVALPSALGVVCGPDLVRLTLR